MRGRKARERVGGRRGRERVGGSRGRERMKGMGRREWGGAGQKGEEEKRKG